MTVATAAVVAYCNSVTEARRVLKPRSPPLLKRLSAIRTQPLINTFHHPEKILAEEDDAEDDDEEADEEGAA